MGTSRNPSRRVSTLYDTAPNRHSRKIEPPSPDRETDAARLLEELTEADLTLAVQGDRLIVTPGDRLTDAHRELIRTHKAELLALIQEREAVAEAIEERAGILEFDAGLPRPIAETQAVSAMRVYRALIAMPDAAPRWLVMLAAGCDLAKARHALDLRFGEDRVLETQEARP